MYLYIWMFLNSAHLVVLCTGRRDMLQYCVKGLPYKMQRTVLTKGVYVVEHTYVLSVEFAGIRDRTRTVESNHSGLRIDGG